MSPEIMVASFYFFYTHVRTKMNLEVTDVSLLEVKNVKKTYTTRFGGNKVEALRDVNFSGIIVGEYYCYLVIMVVEALTMRLCIGNQTYDSQNEYCQ